jgi:hypothetical protein
MEKVIGKPVQPLSVDSQIVGALGAAIYASERYHQQDVVLDNVAQG